MRAGAITVPNSYPPSHTHTPHTKLPCMVTPHQQKAKEAAIRDVPPPVGYRRVKLPAKSATRSIVYDHDVRFEQDVDNLDPKKQLWLCACARRRAERRR